MSNTSSLTYVTTNILVKEFDIFMILFTEPMEKNVVVQRPLLLGEQLEDGIAVKRERWQFFTCFLLGRTPNNKKQNENECQESV